MESKAVFFAAHLVSILFIICTRTLPREGFIYRDFKHDTVFLVVTGILNGGVYLLEDISTALIFGSSCMVDVQKSSTHFTTHTRHNDKIMTRGAVSWASTRLRCERQRKKRPIFSAGYFTPKWWWWLWWGIPSKLRFFVQVFGELYSNLSRVHPRNLTNRPWRLMVGRFYFPFGGPGDFLRVNSLLNFRWVNMQIGYEL